MTYPTDCTSCRWAEMTPWERRRVRLRRLLLGQDPAETVGHMGHAMAGMMRAVTGTAALTEYERHRQAFERTGDIRELERMLRHVAS